MTEEVQNLFWDSCVFIRYLTEIPTEFVSDIGAFIKKAMGGKYLIHYSTISMAEIRPSHLKKKGYGSFQDFLDDFAGAFYPIDVNPNIMLNVGLMRDTTPHNPEKPGSVVIGMGDAIQLASCCFAKNSMGVQGLTFHTFDWKRGTKAGEKTVPIIGFENWFAANSRSKPIADVCSLNRCRPVHEQPSLNLTIESTKRGDHAILN